MSLEEFNQWVAMMNADWIGPQRQSQLLAVIAAGLRNGPLKGPNGEGSLWSIDHFMPTDRWEAPPPKKRGPSMADIKGFFARFGFK